MGLSSGRSPTSYRKPIAMPTPTPLHRQIPCRATRHPPRLFHARGRRLRWGLRFTQLRARFAGQASARDGEPRPCDQGARRQTRRDALSGPQPTALVIEEPVDPSELPNADAVVTNTPGLAVGALAADCAPILLADAEAKVRCRGFMPVGGARRPASSRRRLRRSGGWVPTRRYVAAMGPCIGQLAYEVGAGIRRRVPPQRSGERTLFPQRRRPGSKARLTLPVSSRRGLPKPVSGASNDKHRVLTRPNRFSATGARSPVRVAITAVKSPPLS